MDRHWHHIAVLGAAGKMGSGIALLLLQEMVYMKGATLTLLDTNPAAFTELKEYLKHHLTRYAERNINQLRAKYRERADLVDNVDIIHASVEQGLDCVRFVTSVAECRGARLIFEAITENVSIKAQTLNSVDTYAEQDACYFSNTSSIPIHVLEKESNLKKRLIGFHFYNPPAVQQLLEIIPPADAEEHIRALALDIGRRLNKVIVFSNDSAGFIGNGHFIREIQEACKQVEILSGRMSVPEAISTVNRVTQEFLLRPMGIFQLIDYVGIDVCQDISRIMTTYTSTGSTFDFPLLGSMLGQKISGGQYGDGRQKDGFFHYEQGKPFKVYSQQDQAYVPNVFAGASNQHPQGCEPWKILSKEKEKQKKISQYFQNLSKETSIEGKLAHHFLKTSQMIAHQLVKDGVAHSLDDVNTVLKYGFFHLYDVDDPLKYF